MARSQPYEIGLSGNDPHALSDPRTDKPGATTASIALSPDNWQEHFLSDFSFRPPELVVFSAWLQHAPFAFWLVEKLKPRIFVELGAHHGFSYFAFCQGVRIAGLGTAAFAVDHWAGDEHAGHYSGDVFQRVASYNQQHYADFSTLMRMSFNDALAHFSDSSIDLLHIDGRHYFDDVTSDFETWLPKLSDRAVVLLHDTNVREREFGVQRFWDSLSQRYPGFNFVHGYGLGVLGIGSNLPPAIVALFEAAKNEKVAASVKAAYARLGAAVSASHHAEVASAAEAMAMADLAAERDNAAALGARVAELEQSLAEKEAMLRSTLAAEAQRAQELERHEHNVAKLALECLEAQRCAHELDAELRFARKSRLFKLAQTAFWIRRHVNAVRRRVTLGRVDPLFSARWYLHKNPDVRRSGADAFGHYLRQGAAEGCDPHPLFDSSWYLVSNPDVAGSGVNPLVHFVRHGAAELRSPHPLFDSRWYVEQCPDARVAGRTPLEHYLTDGAGKGLDPHPLFDTSWYLASNLDVVASGTNALIHFLEFGARELRSPHPLFDSRWYVDSYPDVMRVGINPLEHYLNRGADEGRDPSADFDTDWYRAANPEVDSLNPLVHYVLVGAANGRKPNPGSV